MTNLDSTARKITAIHFTQQSLASVGFIAASTLNVEPHAPFPSFPGVRERWGR